MQCYRNKEINTITKCASKRMDHIFRKYPELLNTFSEEKNTGSKSKTENGFKRLLRKHAEKTKEYRSLRKSSILRKKRPEHRIIDSDDSSANGLFTCPVCRKILELPVTVECGHTFCRDCLDKISDGVCFECAVDFGNSRYTNILVQDIVTKWREIRQNESKRNDCNPLHILDTESRYSLRSKCHGLQINRNVNASDKVLKWTAGRQKCKSDEETGTLLASTWNHITPIDLECILCSQCFLDPITTTCGHTFCRGCLARVLDHGLACPLCMSPLKASEQARGTTLILKHAVQLLAPQELTQRLLKNQEEVNILEKETQVPVFVCTNAFPNVACPLFVYEPRYRLLSRLCLQSSKKRFAMAAKCGNGEKFAPYGTLLEVRDAVNLPDGTSILTTIGLRRFKVLSKGEQDGYDTASVQYIKDIAVSSDERPELLDLHQRVHNKAVRWVQSLTPRVLTEIERSIGRMPPVEADWYDLPDGPSWAWWLIPILPLSPQLQVGFLSSTSLEKRLRAIDKMLEHLKIRMKAVERSSLNYSSNIDRAATCRFNERSIDIPYNSQ